MLASQRKQQILQILAEEKQVMSGDLSQRFSVSEDSIRRDLRELAAEGKLQRVHGGALPVSEAIAPMETRKNVQIASKQSIAQRAVELIQPGQVVIVDGGTTTGEMMRLLPDNLACTVVTHSPGIAVALVEKPLIEVILIGGRLFKHSVVSVGSAALESISRINADLFFMGVTGVHPRAGFTTGDYEEAGIKRALAARAAETVVMASQEKLNSASAFAIGELGAASTLIVDTTLDEALRQQLTLAGVEILYAL
ncbi:DeoR/GlpR family DNA-binding transcription regulator [Klebsiella michiganensis]|uniref:DeoR/GlpR family DNA-binding transcription regulator n=2 Tax=Klebsiella michiganensis TaxID=1134687 RepID=UPI0015E4FF51|nr:DeoR/GlpR family DNA-binding transcription regulator [Klebsiella michiganensis]EMB9088662.1 DeoR/GlpR transcriptional regulator [Klebsiella michiganensis]EMD5180602.1 DeoR/GlpR transcriptional regulator [Klebsiella michiganensis]MBA7858439.1 DeoR/GlpR transcriptional regulator [Klebsiella michiganensis]MBA8051161.1 DeoR/GlpR transcriptional regulator [Klebsiella michiganensis]MBA8305865.1 DeoR/GlpR transcriptional regulator [Klebsiella michiganensis]